jgi:AraC-like DNA-binding protein
VLSTLAYLAIDLPRADFRCTRVIRTREEVEHLVLYVCHTPRAPLNAFVERMWLVERGETARQDRILPSGTVELVVNLRDDRVQIDGTIHSRRVRTVSGVAVSGTYSEAFIINAMQHAAMIGVHFRPGSASAVLGVPAMEFADAHVDLANIWGDSFVREMRERLCTTMNHEQRFRYLEGILMERLTSAVRPHPAVLFALASVASTGISVRDVAREAGISYRRFLTVFTRDVGLPPKLFCRIRRFQHVLTVAQRTGHSGWTHVALQCGFYDQSHLANEFRRLSGLTPSQYERAIRVKHNLLDGHVAVP